jgi:D-alanyl-D-alanine carboxypeptidase
VKYKYSNYKNKKGVIFLRGLKYLLLITVVLFILVYIATHFLKKDDSNKNNEVTSAQTTAASSAAETESSSVSTDTSVKSTETDALNGGDDNNVDIDNAWAMFLVNNQNPLPKDYDSKIKTSLVYSSWRDYYMDSRMADYMKNMIEAAKADGINLEVVSAYRSQEYQQQNFDNSLNERMKNGMTYDEAYVDTAASVAFPGKSEHNAGVAADIMSDEYTSMDDDGFENTKAFAWLSEHAAEYGFILRYPKGKTESTGIIYEPWHYRFVGVYYANEIKKSGLCLEEYFESKGWLDSDGKAVQCLGPAGEENTAETSVSETNAAQVTQPPAQTTEESSQKVSIIV